MPLLGDAGEILTFDQPDRAREEIGINVNISPASPNAAQEDGQEIVFDNPAGHVHIE